MLRAFCFMFKKPCQIHSHKNTPFCYLLEDLLFSSSHLDLNLSRINFNVQFLEFNVDVTQSHLLRIWSFPFALQCQLCVKWPYVRGPISALSSLPLAYLSIPEPTPDFVNYWNFIIHLGICNTNPPTLLFSMIAFD